MIGLVITAHGEIPFALGATLEHIFGPQTHIRALSINPDDQLEQKAKSLKETVEKVKGDKGVIITTDLFGGTPANLAMGLANLPYVEVICGMNLPLLIRIIETRQEGNLEDVAKEAQKSGIEHLQRASSLFEIPLNHKTP